MVTSGNNHNDCEEETSEDLVQKEVIPILVNHKMYRFNIYKNSYEQVSDKHAITGWRHMYLGIQYHEAIICISTVGNVYCKMIRSNKYAKEEESLVIQSVNPLEQPVWNDTRVMLQLAGKIYLLLSNKVYELRISGNGSIFSFVEVKEQQGLGNSWKRNCFSVYNRMIFGIDEISGRVLCYEFDTGFTNVIDNGERKWGDCAGIVTCSHDESLTMFTSSGVYLLDTMTGNYKLLGKEEKWSLHNGSVCQVDDSTVLFINSGCVYRWDLHSNQYTYLQRGWRICNLAIPFRPVNEKDQHFLSFGSST